MACMFHNLYVMQGLPQSIGAFWTGENCLLINYWHRDIASQGLSKQLNIVLWPSSWACVTSLRCFCVQNDLGHFRDPIVSSLVFLYLLCNIHVAGVSTEPGGAYSSGAPGLASRSEVHVFTQFCQINVLRIYGYGIPLIGIVVL